MSVLITGGTGFIGASLTRLLLSRQASDVTVFDINPSTQRLDDIASQVNIRQGDLGNFSQVLNAVRRSQPKVIYHLGGMLSVPSERDPQGAFQANAMGTYHVLEAARILNVPQVIFSSSIGTYGYGISDDSMNDLTLQRPVLFYGACKVFGEHMGLFYRRRYNIDFRCVRYPSIVGPGVRTPGALQFVSEMIESSARGNPYCIRLRPDTRVPLLSIQDAARAAVELALADADSIQMVNYLVAGVCPTIQELADVISDRIPTANITFDVNEKLQHQVDQAVHPIDDQFARKEWNWKPQDTTESMVTDILNELQQHPQRYS